MNDAKLLSMLDSLKKISESDVIDAEGSESIKCAACALSYIKFAGNMNEFEKFIDKSNPDLSADQIAHLKSMDLKP